MARPGEAEHGQALVEMAVALPLLLIASIGLVQFAVYAYVEGVVTVALQDGARVASANGSSLDEGLTHSRSIARGGLGAYENSVAIEAKETHGTVAFTATGTYRATIPWLPAVELPLRAHVSMRKERFAVGPGE